MRSGLDLDPVGALHGLRELILQLPDSILGFGLQVGDALVRLVLRLLDEGIGVGLQLQDGGLGLCPHQVDEPVGLDLKLVDPILGLAQLGCQLVRQRHGAVAVLIRHGCGCCSFAT